MTDTTYWNCHVILVIIPGTTVFIWMTKQYCWLTRRCASWSLDVSKQGRNPLTSVAGPGLPMLPKYNPLTFICELDAHILRSTDALLWSRDACSVQMIVTTFIWLVTMHEHPWVRVIESTAQTTYFEGTDTTFFHRRPEAPCVRKVLLISPHKVAGSDEMINSNIIVPSTTLGCCPFAMLVRRSFNWLVATATDSNVSRKP